MVAFYIRNHYHYWYETATTFLDTVEENELEAAELCFLGNRKADRDCSQFSWPGRKQTPQKENEEKYKATKGEHLLDILLK